MPKEKLHIDPSRDSTNTVYADLRSLIELQYSAHGFSFLPRFAVQSLLSGRHRSKLRGRGLDFEEVRLYVHGDDIRNIDWKVTARTRQTHTKVFTEERERPVLIIVDQSSSMFFGTVKYTKSCIAAHLAALAAWRVLHVKDRVGAIIFNDTDIEYVSPKRDRRNVQRILSRVAAQNNKLNKESQRDDAGRSKLAEAIARAGKLTTHDHLVLVISDFNDLDVDSFKSMVNIRRRNDVICMRVLDPMEEQTLGHDTPVGFEDRQVLIKSRSSASARLEKGVKEHGNWLQERMATYQIPLIGISTARDAVTQVRELMQIQSRQKRVN